MGILENKSGFVTLDLKDHKRVDTPKTKAREVGPFTVSQPISTKDARIIQYVFDPTLDSINDFATLSLVKLLDGMIYAFIGTEHAKSFIRSHQFLERNSGNLVDYEKWCSDEERLVLALSMIKSKSNMRMMNLEVEVEEY
ncbi:hypothetical protein JCGZ_10800 [Jatropha curcas]|uniref:Uncharacterized protein n=1 Tax=Jatropha curcas TaxID=180498 RepID=A0A067KH22_JATCU|nr:hypothetical protein JCGZ_10800 [Jatropha curcas]